jgi:cell pole-organizing protein PopZ
MTQPAKAQEPSMEEILASIRRIISDDDPSKAAAPAQKPAAPRPAPMPRAVVPPPPVRAPEPVARDNAMGASDLDSMLAAPVAREEPAADILDLTEQMAAPAVNNDFKTIDGQPDIVFAESDPDVPPPDRDPPAVPEPQRPITGTDRSLMSGPTMAAVDSAFNTLAHTVLVQNARTLEDLVKEMLRPMLKTWLDDNLPGLVERIVRAEIERVSRGRNP